jgi:hypothetical protein
MSFILFLSSVVRLIVEFKQDLTESKGNYPSRIETTKCFIGPAIPAARNLSHASLQFATEFCFRLTDPANLE